MNFPLRNCLIVSLLCFAILETISLCLYSIFSPDANPNETKTKTRTAFKV